MRGFGHLYPWQVASRLAGARLTCRIMDDFKLDMEMVRSEVDRIVSQYAAVTHSSGYHDGGWKAIGLISHDGDPADDRNRPPFKRTPAFDLAPYLDSVMNGLAATKLRVRLMELRPGASILWHYDKGQSLDGSPSVRFHLPIVTNERVLCQLSHQDIFWKEGEIWYGDFSFPHRLFNGGEETRIHLVFDLALDDFVLSLFPKQFLEGKKTRLRAKAVCQRLVDIYEIPWGPSGTKMGRLKKAVRNLAPAALGTASYR